MIYKKLPLEEFMNIYHKVPRAAVDIVIKSNNGWLLTKRALPPYEGMWHIPGGTIFLRNRSPMLLIESPWRKLELK